jgi:hypothetical protein
MIDELTVIYWAVGAFFMGALFVLLFAFFTNNYFKLDILNRLRRGMYMMARYQYNNFNKVTKIVRKSDREVKFFEGAQAFELNKESMKNEDGAPVIDFHHSSTQPAELNPFVSEVVYFMLPKEVKANTSVTIPGEKKGETRTFQQEVTLSAQQLAPAVNNGWVLYEKKINQIRQVAKPSDWASLLLLNESEMEANSLLLKIKQIDKLSLLVTIAVIVAGIGLLVSAITWYNQQGLITQVNTQSALINTMNSSIGTILNRTGYIPVPLTPMGGMSG